MLNLDDKSIVLKSLRITASQELASEDASGQSSSTDSAETGLKAKTLSVTGNIPFHKNEHLSSLFELAEAVESGARKVYRISNKTANALGIKQVRFSGNISAAEQETTRQWIVSFTLSEYRSVPQMKEERLPEAQANQQGGEAENGFQYATLQQNLTDNFGKLRA
ncbi:baseplate complex protein [Shewanella sp.]|uniref:baseplate complex protein n=1 Tax=Shewanella sp. TaxID=50422 RepID=UPI004053B2E7